MGNSPGVPVSPGVNLALDLYQQAQRHGGLDKVLLLRTVQLTAQEAEALWLRYDWLCMNLPKMLTEFYSQTPPAARGRAEA